MNEQHTLLRALSLAALVCGLALVSACGEDEGEGAQGSGTYRATVYGEEFIEEGLPEEVFSDGWSATFERFLVVVHGVEAQGEGGAVEFGGAKVFDLAQGSGGEGHLLAEVPAPAGGWSSLAYTLGPEASATAGNASDADVSRMKDGGLGVLVEGEARKGDQALRFAWGFDGTTRYRDCETTLGTLADGGVGESQLTIHADHLFYDDLTSEEPNVAFDLIASADADADGEVTLEELAAVDITGQARYQVGGEPITDLRAFVTALTRTLGHIDGEGECEVE